MAIRINSAWDAQQFYKEREEARMHINSNWDAQVFYETFGGNGHAGNWGSLTKVGATGYTYNAATKSWTQTPNFSFSTQSFDLSLSSPVSFSSGSSGAISQSGVVNSASDAASDSKTSAEKEYIDIEFNTLTGEISVLPTKANMKLKVGDTVTLKGIGKFLSGLYFISEIRRSVNNDGGYSQTMNLYKNGFGDNLKSTSSESATSPADTGRPIQVDTSKNVVNTAIKVGSKVKIVGDDAIYSNAHEGVKVPNWVKGETLEVDALSEDGLRARLNPIWSWTYIKYLKLV